MRTTIRFLARAITLDTALSVVLALLAGLALLWTARAVGAVLGHEVNDAMVLAAVAFAMCVHGMIDRDEPEIERCEGSKGGDDER